MASRWCSAKRWADVWADGSLPHSSMRAWATWCPDDRYSAHLMPSSSSVANLDEGDSSGLALTIEDKNYVNLSWMKETSRIVYCWINFINKEIKWNVYIALFHENIHIIGREVILNVIFCRSREILVTRTPESKSFRFKKSWYQRVIWNCFARDRKGSAVIPKLSGEMHVK